MYQDHEGPLTEATEYFTNEDRTLNIPDETWADMAREILFSAGDIREDVPIKMEIRYVYRNMYGYEIKYRMVVYEGDTNVVIPPEKPLHLGERKVNPPVIQCLLFPVHDGTEDEPKKPIDITNRLMKYMGPNKDFGSTPFKVFEMFPFDDPTIFRKDFDSILVVDLWKKTVMRLDDTVF